MQSEFCCVSGFLTNAKSLRLQSFEVKVLESFKVCLIKNGLDSNQKIIMFVLRILLVQVKLGKTVPSIFVSFVSKYGYTQNVRKNVTNNTAVDDFLCLLSSEERHDCMLCIFFTRFLQKTNKDFFLCFNNLFKQGKKY